MRRRAAFLVPLAAFVLALAACGGGEEAQPLPEGTTGATTQETTETTATETGGGGGGEVEGDAEAGKDVYASAGCGSCHTLSAAGSSGTIGPNLDETKPDYALIVERVTNGMSPMPAFKDQLSEDDIKNVSAFVFTSTH